MTEDRLRRLWSRSQPASSAAAAALERLRHLPFEDLGFAKVDQHRALRRGVPEVIFGEGKSAAQIAAIGARVAATGANLVVTRLDLKKARELRRRMRAPRSIIPRPGSASSSSAGPRRAATAVCW